MRILADVHGYPPGLNAGAEHYLKAVLEGMVARGHTAYVWIGFEEELRPIGGPAAGQPKTLVEAYRWADVILTHLDRTADVVRRAKGARSVNKPLVHLVHNEAQLSFHGVQLDQADLVVWNSNATRRACGDWQGLQMVLRPIVRPEDYRVETTREFVTLINLNENKGGRLLLDLASRMRDISFLGVQGDYERQLAPHIKPQNLTIWENQDDIRRAYARTRILIVPSAYESYGRVALEAAASGIPVIAHPTPGLVEALGDGGIFVDRSNVGRWVRTIRSLQTRTVYDQWSRRARSRAEEFDAEAELDRFEDALQLITRKAAA